MKLGCGYIYIPPKTMGLITYPFPNLTLTMLKNEPRVAVLWSALYPIQQAYDKCYTVFCCDRIVIRIGLMFCYVANRLTRTNAIYSVNNCPHIFEVTVGYRGK